MDVATVESYDVTKGQGYIIMDDGGRFVVLKFMLTGLEKLEVGQRVYVEFEPNILPSDPHTIINTVRPF